jgi:hypothetical protein
MTQVKFTIEEEIVEAFKIRCAAEGVSMASVVRRWMMDGQPVRAVSINSDTRKRRRAAVAHIVCLLTSVLNREAGYRDNIPEQFEQRIEAADLACDQLADAISILTEAF